MEKGPGRSSMKRRKGRRRRKKEKEGVGEEEEIEAEDCLSFQTNNFIGRTQCAKELLSKPISSQFRTKFFFTNDITARSNTPFSHRLKTYSCNLFDFFNMVKGIRCDKPSSSRLSCLHRSTTPLKIDRIDEGQF